MLEPYAGIEGAVKLYIPVTTYPGEQVANVFYIDDSGTIDSYSLVESGGTGGLLQFVAADAEPQVKAVYTDVTAVNGEDFVIETAAEIRAEGVRPLPTPPAVWKLKADVKNNNSESLSFGKYQAYIINESDSNEYHVICDFTKSDDADPTFVIYGYGFTNNGGSGEFTGILYKLTVAQVVWSSIETIWKEQYGVTSPEQMTLNLLWKYMDFTGDNDPAIPYAGTVVTNDTALLLVTQSGGESWTVQ